MRIWCSQPGYLAFTRPHEPPPRPRRHAGRGTDRRGARRRHGTAARIAGRVQMARQAASARHRMAATIPRNRVRSNTCASSKPHPTRSCYYRASIKRLKRGGVHGLAMAQSDPTSGSEARGPRCGMRSPPPSSGDPAALKVEASAVRSVGSIALGLPFPILAAMARGADPCSGRDCLALGPTARRPHAPPTKVSAQQARWSAENRCRDSGPDQPYGARQYALGRTTHPR